MKIFLSCWLWCIAIFPASAQYIPYHPQVYERGDTLKLPWAGGLNNPVFSNIDLDLDGIPDLLIYEKAGKYVLPFLQKGAIGEQGWLYAPEYAQYFPQEQFNWLILKDFNCDGREDIFAGNSIGRIHCYKNTTPPGGPIQFTPFANPIKTRYPFFTDLSYTTTDLPAFEDVDGDGDLDFLTFGGISTTVEWHRNYAMENYNTCDTFDFRLEEDCWGQFSENQFNNNVTLGISCKGITGNGKTMHAGSTILAFDGTGNGMKDLLIGDISYNTLVYLRNGGTPQAAYMTAKDTTFPSYSVPLNLQVFPAAYYVDINQDGKRDLVVAPFPENASWNVGNVWYYENTQTDASPVFDFRTDSLLNGEMIDVGTDANVSVFDENGDGLPDMLIGNFSYKSAGGNDYSALRLYHNTGTATMPVFTLADPDYLSLSSILGINIAAVFPAVADLDADGDIDLIIGDREGKIHVFKNSAGQGNPCVFTPFALNYNSIDVGSFSTPQLVDFDEDGLSDMIVGKENGTLSYFRNQGGSDGFFFPTQADDGFWGNVDVQEQCCTGYSVPCLFKDTLNTWQLWVGSEQGYIYQYAGVNDLPGSVFTKTDSLIPGIYKRGRMRVLRADINADGVPEIFTGTEAGGVHLYKKDMNMQSLHPVHKYSFKLYPNPGKGLLNWEGIPTNQSLSLRIYSITGQIVDSAELKPGTNTYRSSIISPGTYIVELSGEKGEFRWLYILE